MHRLLTQLRFDHINASKLLKLFKKEVNEFATTTFKPNYHKWQNILLYMTTYQDIFHHPTEEIIFSEIRVRESSLSKELDKIKLQHESLYQKSKLLHRTLSSIETEFIELDKKRLIQDCMSYIELLFNHMNTEENLIFPSALEVLTDSDWTKIEKEVRIVDDPAFSENRKQKFSELYDCVYLQ